MIDIEVDDPAWIAAVGDAVALTRQAANAAAARGDGRAISILLADDATVRDLNARFRRQDRATNVLSFPAGPQAQGHLGDIVLAFGVCASEALGQGKPLADHLRHLVIHGVLHLLDYDHETEDQAARMEMIERDLLAGMGVPDPYAPRTDLVGHDQRRV